MTSNIQPHLRSPPLVDINKEPIPIGLNSSYSIGETVITTNSSVDDMMTSVWPHLSRPPVGINEMSMPPELDSPSGVGATATPSSVSTPSQPFPSSANANEDPTYPGDIKTPSVCSRVEDGLTQGHFKEEPSAPSTPTQSSFLKSPTDKDDKTETLPCLTPVAPVGDYVLQPTVFSSTVGAPVRGDILQPAAFSSAGAFEYPKVYVSN